MRASPSIPRQVLLLLLKLPPNMSHKPAIGHLPYAMQPAFAQGPATQDLFHLLNAIQHILRCVVAPDLI